MHRQKPPISPSGFYIADALTKAGVGSCVRISSFRGRDFDLLFDCGSFDEALTASSNHVFVSHGHIDHVGGCVGHARAKRMCFGVVPNYYIPEESVRLLESVRVASSAMDGHDIEMNIVPIPIGHSVCIGEGVFVKSFRTIHRVESQGYALYSYTSKPKRPSKKGITAHALIEEELDAQLEVVYTGDTIFDALTQTSDVDVFSAPILIIEVTYLDGDYQKCKDRGHIHLDDIISNQELFKNEHIVFVHLSQKYFPYSRALTILKDRLEETDLYSRCWVNLKSFGSQDVLTKVDSVNHSKLKREVGWGWAALKAPRTSNEAPPRRQGEDAGAFKSIARHLESAVSLSSGRRVKIDSNSSVSSSGGGGGGGVKIDRADEEEGTIDDLPPKSVKTPLRTASQTWLERRSDGGNSDNYILSSSTSRNDSNSYKSRACKYFKQGSCAQGSRCKFAHE